MAACNLTVEVTPGPALRCALDVLDLVAEMMPLIPEWHERERVELAVRAQALVDMATAHLKSTS